MLTGIFVVFTALTILFSPMIWMAAFLGPLPPLVMKILFVPTVYDGAIAGRIDAEKLTSADSAVKENVISVVAGLVILVLAVALGLIISSTYTPVV